MRSHPQFRKAVRQFANGIMAQRQAHRINSLLDDRSRLFFGFGALYLYYTRGDPAGFGGFTLPVIKSLAMQTGLCSASRTVAILALMRFAGYIEPDHSVRGARAFMPTEKLEALHRERFKNAFSALALLQSDPDALPTGLQDERFMPCFVRGICETFISGFRLFEGMPELQPFAGRAAGLLMIAQILAEAEETAPSVWFIRMSPATFASRFGVSRSHLAVLLREAIANGLIQRTQDGDERFMVLPRFIRTAELVHARLFAFFAKCASQALRDPGSARP